MLPDSFIQCLDVFNVCFTHPSYRRFLVLLTGWVLCVGKRTITGVIRAAGVVGHEHHSGYHRFFSMAVWSKDEVGLLLLELLLTVLPRGTTVRLIIDDTLARHTGKHIAAGSMHRDPLLSTARKPIYHFGHVWVVLALSVNFRGKTFALPFLTRLYRSEKLNKKLGRRHRKKTQLADELIQAVARAFPDRHFRLIGDNAYVNRSIFRLLPKNFHALGRGRLDAALYAPAASAKHCGRGRPRVKGRRLSSPQQRCKRKAAWKKITVEIPGRKVTVQVQVFDALWYRVARGRVLRLVLVRGWPGHKKDDVLVTTDLTMSVSDIISEYCTRWSIEETFHWVKSRLGFEDPQNRCEQSVERTAPVALWTYSFVVFWYLQWATRRKKLPTRFAPWYQNKSRPSFPDMLATLRRESWSIWISDRAAHNHLAQKHLAPMLDAVGYG